LYWTPTFQTSTFCSRTRRRCCPEAVVAIPGATHRRRQAVPDVGTWIADGRDVVVEDPLEVEGDQPLRRWRDRDAQREVRRNVEAAFLRVQALVLVEVAMLVLLA